MEDGQRSAEQYDAMAHAYAEANEQGAFNAGYERPATIALLGEVAGRQVLEVGCGAGQLTSWLVDNGAQVNAIDVSSKMAALALQRVGDRARVEVADLGRPLPFPPASFDLVVGSLVMHYVRDWAGVLAEFQRVLRPHGAVVFSTHHPTMDAEWHSPDDYFAVKQVSEIWEKGEGEFEVTFWRRPLTAMTEAIWQAGFVIERLVEPAPLDSVQTTDPRAYESLRSKPRFLFFRIRPTEA